MTAVTGKIASQGRIQSRLRPAQSQHSDTAVQRDERLARQRAKLQLKAKAEQYSKMVTLL